jgi:acyl dehydratase
MTGSTVVVGGPWFEDLYVGQRFDDNPSITVTEGMTTFLQALCGDRMRLPLDRHLSEQVTGRPGTLVHPTLAFHAAVGGTTYASQRVRGNLFYKNVDFLRPVFLGDSLSTVTEVVGLRQTKAKPGRPATGLVAMRIQVDNQDGERILDCFRCPVVPLRDPDGDTGHDDSFDSIPSEIDLDAVTARVQSWGWNLKLFAGRLGANCLRVADLVPGTTYAVEARDSVTCAPELSRLILNLAYTHLDPNAGVYPGRRLVYGGLTFSMAGAQTTRALGNLVTIVSWLGLDHTGPVFEGDVLRTDVTVEAIHPITGGALLVLRAVTYAEREAASTRREPGSPVQETPVLDWRFVALAV